MGMLVYYTIIRNISNTLYYNGSRVIIWCIRQFADYTRIIDGKIVDSKNIQ